MMRPHSSQDKKPASDKSVNKIITK